MKTGTVILSKLPSPPTASEAAERATEYLFTNGVGNEAERLMLLLPGGKDGGGWCRSAVRDVIAKAIRGELPPAKQLHFQHLTESTI